MSIRDKLSVTIVALLAAGCDYTGREQVSEGRYYTYLCLDGVKYWNGTRRLAPAFNTDGSLKLCQ